MNNMSNSNCNGIAICDSIVMSVKKKKLNNRMPLAVIIAVSGFAAVIMSFLGMFSLHYDRFIVFTAAILFSAFYILLSLIGRKALWIYAGSALIFAFAVYKKLNRIIEGFKFVYNIVYCDAYHTKTKYYKDLNPKDERAAVTVMFVFSVWLLALVIYYFTICRPNPILPLLVTFPIIEIGLYNGIAVPIFWGMLVIAYWLSLLAMSTIDGGEYTGGTGGFVRKDDLFFPKRQMKLKVTESCGMFVVIAVMVLTLISVLLLQIFNYKRSDKLNEKRKDISLAFEEFNFSDLRGSFARLGEAFGFSVDYDDDKLGRNSSINYDNVTDLVVTFKEPCDGAVYLKEGNKAVYSDNKWNGLDSEIFKNSPYKNIIDTGFFPQDYFGEFTSRMFMSREPNSMTIDTKLDEERAFSPYGSLNYGDLAYYDDSLAVINSGGAQTYKFMYSSSSEVLFSVGYKANQDTSVIKPVGYDSDNLVTYYLNYNDFLNMLGDDIEPVLNSERKYRKFVYANYMDIPDNEDMDDVRRAYSDVLPEDTENLTVDQKIEILKDIRDKISDECEYTLSPGKTPLYKDFISYFVLENHKGYCVHFATAGVILARMAGIPARYTTGYVIVGDDFNNAKRNKDGSYSIDVKDNRSHAWAEVYLDGFGWVPFEFTAGFSERSINDGSGSGNGGNGTQTTTVTAATTTTTTTIAASNTSTSLSASTTTNTNSARIVTTSTTSSSDSGSSFHLKTWHKRLIAGVLIVIALIAAIIVRRLLIVKSRSASFNSGNSRSRIFNIYNYAARLIAYLGITIGTMGYSDFADKAESELGGKYFEKGAFKKLMEISLSSGFSKSSPENSEIEHCLKTADDLARNIYSQTGVFGRLWLKYILVLV